MIGSLFHECDQRISRNIDYRSRITTLPAHLLQQDSTKKFLKNNFHFGTFEATLYHKGTWHYGAQAVMALYNRLDADRRLCTHLSHPGILKRVRDYSIPRAKA